MSHKAMLTEIIEWEEDVCDDCNHNVYSHYDEPTNVFNSDGTLSYVAIGCMILDPEGRTMNTNPYKRCKCLHSK